MGTHSVLITDNIFENSYPLREFDLLKRVHSFFYKAAEFCVLGLGAGAVQGACQNLSPPKSREGKHAKDLFILWRNAK